MPQGVPIDIYNIYMYIFNANYTFISTISRSVIIGVIIELKGVCSVDNECESINDQIL